MQWNREHPKEAAEMYPDMKTLSKEQVTRFIIANVLYLISFLIVLAIKVRSILLAQRLTQEIQLAEAMTGDEFELEEGANGSETASIYETHTEELKTFEPTIPAQPVFSMSPSMLISMVTLLPCSPPTKRAALGGSRQYVYLVSSFSSFIFCIRCIFPPLR
jgi:hypothetical protein